MLLFEICEELIQRHANAFYMCCYDTQLNQFKSSNVISNFILSFDCLNIHDMMNQILQLSQEEYVTKHVSNVFI